MFKMMAFGRASILAIANFSLATLGLLGGRPPAAAPDFSHRRNKSTAHRGRRNSHHFVIADRPTSIAKLQRAARRGDINLRKPTDWEQRRHYWRRKQDYFATLRAAQQGA